MADQKNQREVTASTYRERNSTADRALIILDMFTADRLAVSAGDVAAELSVARSTAYRYLLSLGKAGYLEEDPKGGFRLGLKVFELSKLARASYRLSAIARPILEQLSQETDETALLTRRSGSRAVCLEKEEPVGHRLRLTYERGSVVTLTAGASALVLLAWEDPETIRTLLDGADLHRYTDHTLTGFDEVMEELLLIRAQGFSVTRGHLDPGGIGVAVPVRDDHGRVMAGISVVAVNRRISDVAVEELVTKVQAAAEKLTHLVALTAQ